ncbi:MAG: 4-oxalocrotonate tautomerase family protein [Deferribacterales bacterium]
MPLLRIELWAGKSKELKDAIARDITDVMVKHLNCPPEGVTIVFDERSKADWFTAGKSHEDLHKDK